MWTRRRKEPRQATQGRSEQDAQTLPNLNRLFVGAPPSPQLAVDLFQGEWSSIFPPGWGVSTGGRAPLFEDGRVTWAIDTLGGVDGKRVLELGPLEGGHSFMLERAGAREVVAIEANAHAYLRCLVTKEIAALTGTRFHLGDFVEFLRTTSDQFDVVFCIGVLYHMQEPQELLELISRVSTSVAVWTHYFDPDLIARSELVRSHFDGTTESREYRGHHLQLHRYDYADALEWTGFCGGVRPWANWLSYGDLLEALKLSGFPDITIESTQEGHPNGPAVTLLAQRAEDSPPVSST